MAHLMKNAILLLIILFISSSIYSVPKKKDIFNQESVKITLLPMNTSQSDFGPALIGDSLFFTSFNNENKKRTSNQKNSFCDLFRMKIDDQGNIAGRKQLVEEFAAKYHNGPVSWCKKTGELFITQSNYLSPGKVYDPFHKNYYNLGIAIAKQINGKWKIISSFPYNNSQYSVGHPAISISGDTLIFSSNMKGGYGETDLYMSIRRNGEWSKPVNLGNKINTSGKDEFPYLTDHGYLIFASDGRSGMGGLDLYFTRIDNIEIQHFGKPINSEYDDFSMILFPESEYGYLASKRPGKGEDDIYKFTFDPYKDNFFKLLVMDSKSRKPVSGADVGFDDYMDLKTGAGGDISRKIEEEMSLVYNVKAKGYKPQFKELKTGTLKNGETIQDTLWMDMEKQNIVLRNIYYDFNSSDLLPESIIELENLYVILAENPSVKVSLSSHTDSRGSKIYNQKLSERRVRAAVDFLLSKGIDADRLIPKAFGETVPVNRCIDMIMCSPEEMRMNRRTEFLIPELAKSVSVEQSGKGDYSSGAVKPQKNSARKREKFAVVVGSFKDKLNAENIFNQLNKSGLESKIFKTNNFFVVEIDYKDLKSANDGLGKLKLKYPDARIF